MLEVGDQVLLDLRDFEVQAKNLPDLVGWIKEVKESTAPHHLRIMGMDATVYWVFFPRINKEAWLSENALIRIPPLEQLARVVDDRN